MNVRKLTILQGMVKADVQVGINPWGGAVCVQVSLPRKAPEVQEAMTTLENLMLRTAQEHIKTASIRQLGGAELDRRVEDVIGKERTRIQADAEARLGQRVREAERELDYEKSNSARRRVSLIREIETALHGVTLPEGAMPIVLEVLRDKRSTS